MGPRRFAKDFSIRLAKNEEGPVIEKLAVECGFSFPEWMTWENVYPHWALGVYQEQYPVACLCLSYSRPVGRLEILGIRSDLQGPLRGIVVRRMVDFGSATMKGYGCQAVAGVIPFETPSYKKVAKRNGWVTLASGNLMMKRV